MEDYEEFVAHRRPRRSAHGPAPPGPPAPGTPGGERSLILFYGRPILPPLLSEERREEMRAWKQQQQQQQRRRLQKPAVRGGSEARGKAALVRTLLHSVQLWKAPTLREFSQEKSGCHVLSPSDATGDASSSQKVHGLVTEDQLSFSPPPCRQDGNVAQEVPPLTSTTYSEMPLHHPKPPQQCQADLFFDENEEILLSQPIIDPFVDISHQSESSGYVTYENAENATSVLGRVKSARESCLFGTVEEGNCSGGFFLCSPSNMTTKMPDIISHPPIDGEELERSAIESSLHDCLFPNDMLTEVCSADSPKISEICSLSVDSGPPVEDLATCHPLGTAQETVHEIHHSAQCGTFGQDVSVSGRECPVAQVEVGTDSPQSVPSASDHCKTTQRSLVQGRAQEGDPADALNHDADTKSFEGPYRLSLQALLKKSQECRQQQRMLRNQARKSRVILERAQEKRRDGEQEHSLSDKENEEFPHKVTERMSTKQQSGCIENPADMSLNKLSEKVQKLSKVEDLPLKVSNDEFTNTETLDEANNKTHHAHNLPVFSPKIAKESSIKAIEVVAQTPPDISAHSPAHFSPPSNENTIRSLSNSKSGKMYQVIPTPQLSTSPVHCKSKGLNTTGGSNSTRRDANSEVLVETGGHNVDGMFESEAPGGHKNNQKNVASPVAHLGSEVDSMQMLSRSSAHTQNIDQLELNLSSLKLLISELESTITQNMKNQSHAENGSLPAGFCYEGPAQIQQQTCNEQSVWVDPNVSYNGDKSPDGDGAWQRRRLLDHYGDSDEDTDSELGDFRELPHIRPHKEGDALGSTVNTSAVERGQHTAFTGGLSLLLGGGGGGAAAGAATSNRVQGTEEAPPARGMAATSSRVHVGPGKAQPSIKPITAATQRMLIPDVFRENPVNTSLPIKVLSDTSNQPAKRKAQAALEEGVSSISVSLNQSYDVDRPSGLWLLDGSGSELGSYGPHVPDNKHLTPKSGGGEVGGGEEGGDGGQVGVSKAKRKLLMHAKKEAEERRCDGDRGARPLVHPRTYASTPKASPQERGSRVVQGDEHQQLKLMHAAQWKALEEEQGRQQQQLLQALAGRYSLLQRVSSLCPPSVSRPGDTATLSAPAVGGGGGGGGKLSDVCFQPVSQQSLPERYRPRVAAAVKGFLTRRLLRTERVQRLRRTAKDTQQFLQAFEQQQQQSPGPGELCSRQDLLLWERVTLQLRSALYEIHDVCFSLSAAERMQLIRWDRELARDRELKQQQTGQPGHAIGKSSLSAATQKSLERKRGIMIQQNTKERLRGPRIRSGQGPGATAEPTPRRRPGQPRTAKPQRGSKTTAACRH